MYLYGMSGPEMGLGEMVLDGKMISRVNMTVSCNLPVSGSS